LLTNLNGLDNISTIPGNLLIRRNDVLTDISGLQNFNSLEGELGIHNNPLLNNCSIQSICNYLLVGGGNVNIGDNGYSCSTSQIIFTCDPAIYLGSIVLLHKSRLIHS